LILSFYGNLQLRGIMPDPAIEIRNLSKSYNLGGRRTTHLKDELSLFWQNVRGRMEVRPKAEFWALRDVSFDVSRGEVIGIVGRNGAGKSTLLKILSRITQQTAGEVVLRGRVASLLEVGTGFHPDLTGRENIYLNGAILGMTRSEIKSRFDEIVAFAEIEKFTDTPVKRYSSGMYVRLAFAVAAHLEPEILIVDEVLAVGDAEFQRKCLGKMRDVASSHGRTVLFVSHNPAAVSALCQRAVYLKNGTLAMLGDTGSVISAYLESTRGVFYEKAANPLEPPKLASIQKAWIGSDPEKSQETITTGAKFTLNVEIFAAPGQPIELLSAFHDQFRRPLFTSLNSSSAKASIPQGKRVLVKHHYILPDLCSDSMVVDLAISESGNYPFLDHVLGAMTVSIARRSGIDYKTKNSSYPLLIEVEQEVLELGR
jgi:ABC-type polysaccharide/polyol phosphate transport system ATPase subunit